MFHAAKKTNDCAKLKHNMFFFFYTFSYDVKKMVLMLDLFKNCDRVKLC